MICDRCYRLVNTKTAICDRGHKPLSNKKHTFYTVVLYKCTVITDGVD
nr:MAG TPA: hypothetical protein [Caudoviricetes sp.]